MKKLTFLLICILAPAMMNAQNLRDCVTLGINDEDGVYAKGDKVQVWADVRKVPGSETVFDLSLYGDAKRTETRTVALKEGRNILFEGTFDEAIHYMCTLRSGDNSAETTENILKVGFIVSPEDFELGFDEPKDALKYWKQEFRKMRKEKMNPIITNQQSSEGYDIYELKLNCVGPAPVRAYVSHPQGAKKKSLPIILYLHAAGSPGSPSSASTAKRYAKYGALAMDLNAHGMLNDQPKEYYDTLSAGTLKGYSSREPVNKDDYYFKWMFLRAERALDYLMADPLWDGKHIIVCGTSQGGGQSSFLAAVNKHVTAAALEVPAMLDQGGALKGRINSWPKTMNNYPESSAINSPYFDPGIMLHHTKAHIFCEIGLFDITCPAPNLYATMNSIKTYKVVMPWQRQHHFNTFNRDEHQVISDAKEKFFKYELTR